MKSSQLFRHEAITFVAPSNRASPACHDDVLLDLPDSTRAVDPGAPLRFVISFRRWIRSSSRDFWSLSETYPSTISPLAPDISRTPSLIHTFKLQSRARSSFKTTPLRNSCAAAVKCEPTTRPSRLNVRRATGSQSSIESPAPNTAIARCSFASRSAHEMLSIVRHLPRGTISKPERVPDLPQHRHGRVGVSSVG